jgi:flagellar biosynthesis GTPase FlhF
MRIQTIAHVRPTGQPAVDDNTSVFPAEFKSVDTPIILDAAIWGGRLFARPPWWTSGPTHAWTALTERQRQDEGWVATEPAPEATSPPRRPFLATALSKIFAAKFASLGSGLEMFDPLDDGLDDDAPLTVSRQQSRDSSAPGVHESPVPRQASAVVKLEVNDDEDGDGEAAERQRAEREAAAATAAAERRRAEEAARKHEEATERQRRRAAEADRQRNAASAAARAKAAAERADERRREAQAREEAEVAARQHAEEIAAAAAQAEAEAERERARKERACENFRVRVRECQEVHAFLDVPLGNVFALVSLPPACHDKKEHKTKQLGNDKQEQNNRALCQITK